MACRLAGRVGALPEPATGGRLLVYLDSSGPSAVTGAVGKKRKGVDGAMHEGAIVHGKVSFLLRGSMAEAGALAPGFRGFQTKQLRYTIMVTRVVLLSHG